MSVTEQGTENQKRVILLIGNTGNGKSTLANTITKTNNFKESALGLSETKGHQIETVDIGDTTYVVVDTIGIGDTGVPPREVLLSIADACYALREGFHQLLFVTTGRFTEDEKFAYNLLRTTIFNEEVLRFTTIVRTRFEPFQKPEACEKDERLLRQHYPMFANCNRMIHVNNISEDYSPEAAEEAREAGHLKLALHLRGCAELYRPKNLDDLNKRIESFQTDKEKAEEAVKHLTEQIRKLETDNELACSAWNIKLLELQREMADDRNKLQSEITKAQADAENRMERQRAEYLQQMERDRAERLAEIELTRQAQAAQAQQLAVANQQIAAQMQQISQMGRNVGGRKKKWYECAIM